MMDKVCWSFSDEVDLGNGDTVWIGGARTQIVRADGTVEDVTGKVRRIPVERVEDGEVYLPPPADPASLVGAASSLLSEAYQAYLEAGLEADAQRVLEALGCLGGDR
jgi:hypothetical protein